MSSVWTPQAAATAELLGVLKNSSSMNSDVQRSVTEALERFLNISDYPCYLVYILAYATAENENTRAVAGLILKNNVRLLQKASDSVVAYVKANVLTALADSSLIIRTNAGTLVSTLLATFEPQNWPEGLLTLISALDSPDPSLQDTALSTLDKLCQDFPRKLDTELNGIRPLDYMIPKFLGLTSHPWPSVRKHALDATVQFSSIQSQSFYANIDNFISCLFKCASDDNAEVRRIVCQCLANLLQNRPDRLVPEMQHVAQYMLYCMQDKDENVALEACEFWLSFAESIELVEALRPLLLRLIPALLQVMVYTETDLMILEGMEEDTNVPDREMDIRPQHYGGKTHGVGDGPAESHTGFKSRDAEMPDEDDFELDEDDDDFDEEFAAEWNLRKCAAAALDVLAVRFGAQCLEILLPELRTRLYSQDWLLREVATLSLGAVAEGCAASLEQHLDTIIPYLLNALTDTRPLIRSIACWTLGRYAHFCAVPNSRYLIPTMEGLLRMILDDSKRVQEAGCSAFATFEEDAGSGLVPYLKPILQNMVTAFDKYQHKNLLILYDAIGTLADSVGAALDDSTYVDLLMPAIIRKWQVLQDDDTDLVPLLECLASVTVSAGKAFLPYAVPVFDRCNRIAHEALRHFQTFALNPEMDEPESTPLIVSLDLISGLVQGLGTLFSSTLQNSDFMPLLSYILSYPQPSAQQSAFALVGDMAIKCFDVLKPYLPHIMPVLLNQLQSEPKAELISVCNNAAWSIGEVVVQCGPDPGLAPYVVPLMQSLVTILMHPKSPKSLTENAAVTIGRLGHVFPTQIAPQLELFAEHWCQALAEIKDNAEKDSAFKGFCSLVINNPQALGQAFPSFCVAASKWQAPSAELNQMFQQIFEGFKAMAGSQWEPQILTVPEPARMTIRTRYNV